MSENIETPSYSEYCECNHLWSQHSSHTGCDDCNCEYFRDSLGSGSR